jgi:hypothetical protein
MTPQLIKRGMGEAKLEVMAEPTLRWPPVADEPAVKAGPVHVTV